MFAGVDHVGWPGTVSGQGGPPIEVAEVVAGLQDAEEPGEDRVSPKCGTQGVLTAVD